MAAPTIESVTPIQRDVAATYFVDVAFRVFDADGDTLTGIGLEFRIGPSGPFTPASAQALDIQHTADTPTAALPTASPGLDLNFVWNSFSDLIAEEEKVFTDIFLRLTLDDSGAEQAQTVVGPITVSNVLPEDEDLARLSQARQRRSIAAATPDDFLGVGLVVPFERRSRDFNSARGGELVASSISIILGTRAAVGEHMGELEWRPDFGAKLWVLRHRRNDSTLRATARAFVSEAFRWEPRAEVTEVFAEREPFTEPNELRIRVRHQLIDENTDENRVFPPQETELVVS